MSPARHHHALPEGYRLHWYEIDSILGQGGFGITYLALDTNLDQLVAIKEFLPSDLAVRTQDSAVHPLSGSHTDTYGWGLNRFLSEARTLAKFRHPNIVRVMSVFEANNTAYMIMEYERGESFENMLKFKQVSGEPALKNILLALLDGLELVHDAGFIHRDIKPSNVYLREDGVPVLLDFGSARLALGVETRTLTSLVSPGYAPFEQYNATRESDKQGPWTDIYALGATMYRAVTGQGPIDAAARADVLLDEQRDPFQPCAQMALENYSAPFLQSIDRALAFPPGERPQSVAAWRQLIAAGAVDNQAETVAVNAQALGTGQVDFVLDGEDVSTVPVPSAETATVPMAELQTSQGPPRGPGSSGRIWFISTSIVAIAGIAIGAWLSRLPGTGDAARPEATAPAATPVDRAIIASSAPDAGHVTPPAAPTANITAPAREPIVAQPAKQVPAGTAPQVTELAPAPQAPPPEMLAKAVPAPAPAPAPTVISAPTPARTPAPIKKPSQSATAPKKAPAAKSTAPLTRQEKVAARLVTAEENLRAGRLTKPKRRNALGDYLTVLAMERDNAAARSGVEHIVELYVAKAQKATQARQLEAATSHLRQARFVLDAMELRKWPSDAYDALFAQYREADRLLAAAR